MTEREAVAQAMAFFEASDDIVLLHQALAEVAPRARRMVSQFMGRGGEEAIPSPADLRPARQLASKADAMRTLKSASDFALLQVLARSVGRRIEAIEIAASAEFPEGVHVVVPANPTFPPSGAQLSGTVESTGTVLRVLLDNGETWDGPPSLARLA